MRHIKLLLSLCCCLLCSLGFSQYVIKGRAIDSTNGEPIYAAVIGEKGTGNGTISDFDGDFTLKVETLPVVLIIGLIGYDPQEITVSSADKKLEIKLVLNSKMTEEVVVIEDRILEKQKKNPLTVESMDAIAIKEVPTGNFYEGLAALKGVDMASASLAFRVINTRGFNSTSPVRVLQLIDGVDNQSPGLNFSLGNFLGAPDFSWSTGLRCEKCGHYSRCEQCVLWSRGFQWSDQHGNKRPIFYSRFKRIAKSC